MLYLTCTTITSVDLAHYGVSRAHDWVSVDCGTNDGNNPISTRCFTVYMYKFEASQSVAFTLAEFSKSNQLMRIK